MDKVLEGITHSDAVVRQAACFAVNVACQISRFSEAARVCAEKLVQAIQGFKSKEKDALMVTT